MRACLRVCVRVRWGGGVAVIFSTAGEIKNSLSRGNMPRISIVGLGDTLVRGFVLVKVDFALAL